VADEHNDSEILRLGFKAALKPDHSCLNRELKPPEWIKSIVQDNLLVPCQRKLVISLSKCQAVMTPQASKHLKEAKEIRDYLIDLKQKGNQAAREQEFHYNGPDNLPTDESEEY
jgi:hypothetical protein